MSPIDLLLFRPDPLSPRQGLSGLCWLARRLSRCVLFALLLLLPLVAPAEIPVPPLTAPVIDQTGTLSSEQIAALDRTLRDFHERKGSQISVLLVPTTRPESIEQYSIRVVEQWQLGRRGVDDGVLLLVAKDDRTVRIEVGYGLEGALPDVIANRITEQVIVPRFRQGDFAGGISEGVNRIVAVIEGEPLPAAEPRRSERSVEGIGSALPLLLMLVFVGSGILRRIFGSLGGAAVLGGIAGVIAWVLTAVMGVAIGAALIAFFFTLLGGGGGGGWSSGRRGGWGGGGFGSGWSGGGGGGGWRGGGGGFGGGGASGRW